MTDDNDTTGNTGNPSSDNRRDARTTDTSLALIEEQADASIRREWHEQRWFFSVIDVVGVLTDSPNPRNYWNMLKRRLRDEGASELYTNCVQLKLRARDGKRYATDAADTETLLRIIQSIPSPKAEPVKQWLARVGAARLDAVTRPLDAAQSAHTQLTIAKPAPDAPAALWARYHEQLAALYYRQAVYEEQMRVIDARMIEHDTQLGELHSRVESLEAGQRLLPEILERLGPQPLTPEHQATVKALAGRLHALGGYAFATIYGDLTAAFHVGKYSDIPDARWLEVTAWFQRRIDANNGHRGTPDRP
ncbi:MAG: BRO family protein [Ktedonobacterales bacterium]